jgi:hypothetical protein
MQRLLCQCTKSAYDNRSPPYTLVVCDLPMEAHQLVAFILSTVTSAGMLAFKLAKIPLIRLRWREREMLQVERTRLLVDLLQASRGAGNGPMPTPGAAADGDSAAHPASQATPAEGASAQVAAAGGGHNGVVNAPALVPAPAPAPAALDPEFTFARNAPVSSSAAGPSRSSAPEEPSFRGLCPACNRNVYTSDEGRVKEGDRYYHRQCVKGVCRRCGNNVYGDQERGREGDAYYHIQCPP